MLDANSAYTLADAPLFQRIDAYAPMMIEQPLAHDDIVDHAALQREIKTPICLDESIHSGDDARKAIELGATRIVNIKAGRVGGLTSARRVHDVCREARKARPKTKPRATAAKRAARPSAGRSRAATPRSRR